MKWLILLATCLAAQAMVAGPSAPIPLWPGVVPGEKKILPAEADQFKSPPDPLIAGRPIIRLGNVATPTITIYRPEPAKDTGAAVVVCPGGGYFILAHHAQLSDRRRRGCRELPTRLHGAHLSGRLGEPGTNDAVRPEVMPVKGVTPPAFIAMAQDDPVRVENATGYYVALKNAGVPAELHLYPTGGHGYGLRTTADNVTTWPERAGEWLRSGGWLEPTG